ncbi:MAG: hypothetical protein P4M11_03395 [Candidatus Pacebacteria bacterium]|nr:hypothetical protein [Candidatus Paceibacterota bacterium]
MKKSVVNKGENPGPGRYCDSEICARRAEVKEEGGATPGDEEEEKIVAVRKVEQSGIYIQKSPALT